MFISFVLRFHFALIGLFKTAVRFLNGKFIQSHVNFVILRGMFVHEALDFSSLRIIEKYIYIRRLFMESTPLLFFGDII